MLTGTLISRLHRRRRASSASTRCLLDAREGRRGATTGGGTLPIAAGSEPADLCGEPPRLAVTGKPRIDARERWRINPERSTLRFSIGHADLREIRGQFHCWGGMVLIDPADSKRSSLRVWVDLSSIDTGSAARDHFILATELFDMHWEPALVFDSVRVEITGVGRGVVLGRLALHSFGKEIAVAIKAKPPRRDDKGVWHLVYTARTSIDRGALGLRRNRYIKDWLGESVVGETIEIAAHVEAARDNNLSGHADSIDRVWWNRVPGS
jgi:polyisoprenoid-binding protein YceI